MDSTGQLAPTHPRAGAPERATSLEDLDEVARLYAEEALSVRRLVRLHVSAPAALIEDACQIAWCRLLIHRARLRPESARAWLVRVAVHEALRSIRRDARMRSLDELQERDGRHDDGRVVDRRAVPAPDLIEELVERRARLDSVGGLPDRQRRLLWLQGLGLSYREMAGETGMTRRTVERQLMRARSSLVKSGAGA
jgi:RNA polymerase sigma factor (sigma-70 family)